MGIGVTDGNRGYRSCKGPNSQGEGVVVMSDANLSLRYSKAMIASAVARLGAEISHDYKNHNPLLVGVLNGAFVFLADLIRTIVAPASPGYWAPAPLNKQRRHFILLFNVPDRQQGATAFYCCLAERRPDAAQGLQCLTSGSSYGSCDEAVGGGQGLAVPYRWESGHGNRAP